MKLHHQDKQAPQNVVVVDKATGRRIPYVTEVDVDTGEWKAIQVAPDGYNYLLGDDDKPVVVHGRAERGVAFEPIDKAAVLGLLPEPPKGVRSEIKPLSAQAKQEGMDMYMGVHRQVWHEHRGLSKVETLAKFEELLHDCDFLDDFVIKTVVPTRLF